MLKFHKFFDDLVWCGKVFQIVEPMHLKFLNKISTDFFVLYFNPIQDGHFRAAYGWGAGGWGGSKKPKEPKEDPKIYESHDTPPVFC